MLRAQPAAATMCGKKCTAPRTQRQRPHSRGHFVLKGGVRIHAAHQRLLDLQVGGVAPRSLPSSPHHCGGAGHEGRRKTGAAAACGEEEARVKGLGDKGGHTGVAKPGAVARLGSRACWWCTLACKWHRSARLDALLPLETEAVGCDQQQKSGSPLTMHSCTVCCCLWSSRYSCPARSAARLQAR